MQKKIERAKLYPTDAVIEQFKKYKAIDEDKPIKITEFSESTGIPYIVCKNSLELRTKIGNHNDELMKRMKTKFSDIPGGLQYGK